MTTTNNKNTMKAAIYNEYGSPEVVNVRETERPEPGEKQILVRVMSSTVGAGDSVMRKGDPYASRFVAGLTKPKNPVLGYEFAGIVAEVGEKSDRFKVGDRIFGTLGIRPGAHAEYLLVDDDAIMDYIPEGIEYNEVSSLPVGAMTALYFLKKGNIRSGQKVLIYGASGAVGSYAVQLAKHFGTEVTAVTSTDNVELVRSIGANHVIDYKKENVWELKEEYDLIFDTVGKLSYNKAQGILKDEGFYVSTRLTGSILMHMMQSSILGKKRAFSGLMKSEQSELEFLAKLVKKGEIKSVVDSIHKLEQIAEAHALVDGGHKKGNVIIELN